MATHGWGSRGIGLALCLAASAGPGCYGAFRLTHTVATFNREVSRSPVARELVFVAFVLVPVYEVSVVADLLVLNPAELIRHRNPLDPEFSPDRSGVGRAQPDGPTIAVADADGLWLAVSGQKARKLVKRGGSLAVLEDGAPIARLEPRDDGSIVVTDRYGAGHVVDSALVDEALAAAQGSPEALLGVVTRAMAVGG